MHVLHPMLLWGAALAALPLCAHLFTHRSRRKIAFAPIALLMGHPTSSPAWTQVSHKMLLLLRMGLLVLLAGVVAHLSQSPKTNPQSLTSPVAKVWVIDTSASMNYRLGDTTLLAKAVALAQQGMVALPADALTGVVVTQPPAPNAPSAMPALSDPTRAQQALTTLVMHRADGPGDVAAALAEAAKLLAQDAADAPQEIVVLGDLSRNGYAVGGPWRVAGSAQATVRFVDVAARPVAHGQTLMPLENAGVMHMALSPPNGEQRTTLTVRVKNFGAQPMHGRALHCALGDSPLGRGFVDCAPGQICDKTFLIPPDVMGPITVTATLAPAEADGFMQDDHLKASLVVKAPTRVLAVDGSPHHVAHQDELFFVSRALAQIPRGVPPIALTRIDRSDLEKALMAAHDGPALPFDVLILANVGDLNANEVMQMMHLRRQGMGLVVALGDELQLSHEASVQHVMAVMPYEVRDAFNAGDKASTGGPVRLGALASDHRILAGLGDDAYNSLRQVGTQHYVHVVPQKGCKSEVLLAYATGAPALLVDEGLGTMGPVALWTTTMDVDWTDLPLSGGFVPLLQRVVHYAGHKALAARVAPDAQPESPGGVPWPAESDFTPVQPDALHTWEQDGQMAFGMQDTALGWQGRTALGWVSALMLILWTFWGLEAWWSTPQTRAKS